MNTNKQYIDLKLPSIMGMGAVGPTLATLTAALYGAVCASVPQPAGWVYPVIMLVLSGLLAVFPVSKAEYPNWQRVCLWPIATAIVFSTAWGTNHGLSMGEEALSQTNLPDVSFVSTAKAQATNVQSTVGSEVSTNFLAGAVFNQVPFDKLDTESKSEVPQQAFKSLPENTWGVGWVGRTNVYLKDGDGVWWSYRLVEEKEPEVKQAPLRGGFFKRF